MVCRAAIDHLARRPRDRLAAMPFAPDALFIHRGRANEPEQDSGGNNPSPCERTKLQSKRGFPLAVPPLFPDRFEINSFVPPE